MRLCQHASLVLAEVHALRRYISRAIFFMYPYVFVAGPNKHDNLFDYLCRRNAKFDSRVGSPQLTGSPSQRGHRESCT
jgi:hypothetical protein